MTAVDVLPNPFAPDAGPNRFDAVFDAERFTAELEPPPLFLSGPGPEFLSVASSDEFRPIFDLLREFAS